jgi:hypothetical protein
LAQRFGEVAVERDSERRWRLLLGFDEQTPGPKRTRRTNRRPWPSS